MRDKLRALLPYGIIIPLAILLAFNYQLFVVKNGSVVTSTVGAAPKAKILEMLKNA